MPNGDSIGDEFTDEKGAEYGDDQDSIARRFERAVRGLQKPKTPDQQLPFRNIKNEERKRRLSLVQQCIDLGMAVEQISDFLITWGLGLSRSTVYEYLQLVKTSRRYATSEGQQSHHDYYIFRFFIRIATDAHAAGYRTSKLNKGRLAWEGARFRPDFSFWVRHYWFMMELQLSDLTETRWSVKFANYWRLREMTGMRFRVLFVIDQRGDMTYVRAAARRFLERKREPDSKMFLFICLNDMKGSANVATDPAWLLPNGKRVSLLEYVRRPGQKPTVQSKR